MPALFDGVMPRAISVGSERVAGQLFGRKDNTEQRVEKGNNHKSTSSGDLARCVGMRKGALGAAVDHI